MTANERHDILSRLICLRNDDLINTAEYIARVQDLNAQFENPAREWKVGDLVIDKQDPNIRGIVVALGLGVNTVLRVHWETTGAVDWIGCDSIRPKGPVQQADNWHKYLQKLGVEYASTAEYLAVHLDE